MPNIVHLHHIHSSGSRDRAEDGQNRILRAVEAGIWYVKARNIFRFCPKSDKRYNNKSINPLSLSTT